MTVYNQYRVTFTHSAPVIISALNRKYAINKAIFQLRNWDGFNTKTQKRKCIVSCKLFG